MHVKGGSKFRPNGWTGGSHLSSSFPQVQLYYCVLLLLPYRKPQADSGAKRKMKKKKKENYSSYVLLFISCGDLEGKMPATFFALLTITA